MVKRNLDFRTFFITYYKKNKIWITTTTDLTLQDFLTSITKTQAAMTAVVRLEDELNLKPIDLCPLLRTELKLGPCYDLKPKAIVELANTKLSRETIEGASVKDECLACRASIRTLPPSFWSENKVRSNSTPEELLERILAKPCTAGGFCSAVTCKVINPKAIDNNTVVWGGALNIDGFTVLRSPGQFCTTAVECKNFQKLVRSEKNNEKLGDTTFHMVDKSQPVGGQTLLLMKSNKCSARLAALFTPKFGIVALYHFVDTAHEEITLSILEDMRVEAFENRK